MTYYQVPPIGPTGILFLSSVIVVLALGSALLSIVVAGILLARRKPPKLYLEIALSALSIVMAFIFIQVV